MEYKEITYEQIRDACTGLKTTNIKGKEYVQVNERVNAFRKVCPEGYITTRIISDTDGVCVMEAEVGKYVFVEGVPTRMPIATGIAYEVQSSSYINKTSYLENCQTSAIGRALGFAGYGLDVAIASAEEMTIAVEAQAKAEIISPQEAVVLEAICKDANVNIQALLAQYKVKSFEELNAEQYAKINRQIENHRKLNALP